jgi:hypothetical protein
METELTWYTVWVAVVSSIATTAACALLYAVGKAVRTNMSDGAARLNPHFNVVRRTAYWYVNPYWINCVGTQEKAGWKDEKLATELCFKIDSFEDTLVRPTGLTEQFLEKARKSQMWVAFYTAGPLDNTSLIFHNFSDACRCRLKSAPPCRANSAPLASALCAAFPSGIRLR